MRVTTVRAMSLVLVDRNVRPHVSVITLNKPERLNSMSFPLVNVINAVSEGVLPKTIACAPNPPQPF